MMIPARIPMMAITTRSSMRVKADEDSVSFGFIITIIYCYGYIISGGGGEVKDKTKKWIKKSEVAVLAL
jgi:ABC-type transporter Mla maintaining outer membrane lipid asymmetry permease subunit MlaE